MKIIIAYPPNIRKIKAKLKPGKYTIFTYGDTIYNPSNCMISPDLSAHEKTHQVQQMSDPETWWDKYLADPKFRLEQELEAYRGQWKLFSEFSNRQQKRHFLKKISGDLSGPMYGNIITTQEAKELITQLKGVRI